MHTAIDPWISYSAAARLPLNFYGKNAYEEWYNCVATLASKGDLTALDTTMRVITPPIMVGATLDSINPILERLLRWPHNRPGLVEWYWAVRPRLHSGRDELGGIAFWLDEGAPFDQNYLASMPRPSP